MRTKDPDLISSRSPRWRSICFLVIAFVGASSCAKVTTAQPPPTQIGNADASGFADGFVDGLAAEIGGTASDARGTINSPGTDAAGDVSTCAKATCNPTGGQYCGLIGDKCGGTLDCGACPTGQSCEVGRCVVMGCTSLSCKPTSGTYCGKVGDGCGRDMDCGACPSGQLCTSGVCTLANCVPLTCTSATGRFCGTVGDGCGGSLNCGNCPAGSMCGSGGVAGICAPTNCTPISCTVAGGGQYCGHIGNGCGGALDCPVCSGGAVCGSGGAPNVCPGATTTGGCTGLACQIDKCTGKSKTTVKGTVYDPAGKLPLYNVMVYVPNAPLDPIVEGVTCQKCGTVASGRPVASALTDAAGNFTMADVPVGTNIPVVIQTGKWRRQVTLPAVKACQDNVFTGAEMFRLPKNQTEGHLPKIAMTRGHADSLECVLRRMGISDSEFTNPDGSGRVNIYFETGNAPDNLKINTGYDSGVAFPLVATMFNSAVIRKYDMVVISCHGESDRARAQPLAQKQIVKDFVDSGGRVFGSHFSFGYFRGTLPFMPSPWPPIATWDGAPDAPYTIETSFAKGVAFADWLLNVNASTTRGQIAMTGVESPAMSLLPGFGGQRWINSPGGIPYFSVPMPVEKASTPAEQCGRFVHTGIHVANGGNSGPFPSSCGTAALSPQEKAWEFLIFELSACAIPDSQTPDAPVIPPPGAPSSPPPAVTTPPPPPPPAPPPPPPPIP